MTQDTLTGDPHIADGDILRFHDDECNSVERDRIARHLAECPTCVESSKFFQAVSKQLDASLDEIEVQPIEGAKQRFLTARARVTHSAPQLGKPRRVQLLRAAATLLMRAEGFSYREIGAALEISSNSVGVVAARALRKLATVLQPYQAVLQ